MDNNNISSILFRYLERKNILVDKKKFNYILKSHPQYPKLMSVVETLDKFKIEHSIYETSISDIDASVNCFIAVLKKTKTYKGSISLIERNNDEFYKIDSKKVPLKVIEKYWSDIILIIEENKKLQKGKRKKTTFNVFVFFSAILVLLTAQNFNIKTFTFYLFPLMGVVLSIITLKGVFDIDNSLSKRICEVSKKTDCEAVINSKKWALFKVLDFSDLGLTFFIAQIISLFFLSLLDLEKDFFLIQLFFLMLSSPLILASLYFQSFIARNWCTLCLGIILILILEFILISIFYNNSYTFSLSPFIFNSIIFALIFFLWKQYKRLLIENKNLVNKDIDRNHFLFNYKIFKSILKIEKQYNYELDFINFNNSKRNQNITLVTDPFCDYCKNIHAELHELSNNFENNINWNVIFNIDIEDEPNIDKAIYRNIINHQLKNDKSVFKKALHDWYLYKNDVDWLNKYSNKFDIEEIDDILNKQHEWCVKANINYTPALFINGYLLPNIYTAKDLMFLIEELFEDGNF